MSAPRTKQPKGHHLRTPFNLIPASPAARLNPLREYSVPQEQNPQRLSPQGFIYVLTGLTIQGPDDVTNTRANKYLPILVSDRAPPNPIVVTANKGDPLPHAVHTNKDTYGNQINEKIYAFPPPK